MRRLLILPAILVLVLQAAGPGQAAETQSYVVTVKTVQGNYRAVITDPETIEKAKLELAGGGDAGVPIGELAWGDGGVNKGHKWHVVDLQFADFTIELCDGTAKMVDRDPAYWIDTVGYFCPWSGEVVKLKPVRTQP